MSSTPGGGGIPSGITIPLPPAPGPMPDWPWTSGPSDPSGEARHTCMTAGGPGRGLDVYKTWSPLASSGKARRSMLGPVASATSLTKQALSPVSGLAIKAKGPLCKSTVPRSFGGPPGPPLPLPCIIMFIIMSICCCCCCCVPGSMLKPPGAPPGDRNGFCTSCLDWFVAAAAALAFSRAAAISAALLVPPGADGAGFGPLPGGGAEPGEAARGLAFGASDGGGLPTVFP
mmetsp:Transcript_34449/g.89761  ORF Transcript_34449/g.89761 Transcript_34449/m.89761 type:complete len:230 (-) Transcript_34449:822-1511(-)